MVKNCKFCCYTRSIETVKTGSHLKENSKNWEPFRGKRYDIFPVPVPFRPIPVPLLSTVDKKPSNAASQSVVVALSGAAYLFNIIMLNYYYNTNDNNQMRV